MFFRHGGTYEVATLVFLDGGIARTRTPTSGNSAKTSCARALHAPLSEGPG